MENTPPKQQVSASHLSADRKPQPSMLKSLLKSPVQTVRRLSPSLRRPPKRHVQRDVVVVQGAESDMEESVRGGHLDDHLDDDAGWTNSPVKQSSSLVASLPSRSRSVAAPVLTNPNLLVPEAEIRRNSSTTETEHTRSRKPDRKLHKFRTLRQPEGTSVTSSPPTQQSPDTSFDSTIAPLSPHMRSPNNSSSEMLDAPQLVGGVPRKMRRPSTSEASESFVHSPPSARLSATSELSQFALDRQNSIKRMRSRKKSLNDHPDHAQIDAAAAVQAQRL